MGKGAIKTRKEAAKARKQQEVSAASTPALADHGDEPDLAPSIPKRGRGHPRKNPVTTIPSRVTTPCSSASQRSTANVNPSTSDDVSETDSIGDKHPIEMIVKTIQQTSSASSGNAAESSDDDSFDSESLDTIDLGDNSGLDDSEPVMVVLKTQKSGRMKKAVKNPKNAG